MGTPPRFWPAVVGVYSHDISVKSLGKYGIPARGPANTDKTLPQYETFRFKLDLPLHMQSLAATFGVLGITSGTAIPVRDRGTFGPGGPIWVLLWCLV